MHNPEMQESDQALEVLDTKKLGALFGISSFALIQRRWRNPKNVPPAFCDRPLLWRKEAVLLWMREREGRSMLHDNLNPPKSRKAPVAVIRKAVGHKLDKKRIDTL